MKKILLIDKDDVTLDLTKRFLVNYGFDVQTVRDSADVLNQLKDTGYELILSEIEMDGLNGFDLVKLMQKCCITTPVGFLTSQDDETTKAEAENQGIELFISKKKEYVNLPHILDHYFYGKSKIAV
jgi:two-component system phosphate regulon response regulator OmpR